MVVHFKQLNFSFLIIMKGIQALIETRANHVINFHKCVFLISVLLGFSCEIQGQKLSSKSDLISSIEELIYYSPKDEIRFLSVFISKNKVIYYKNDFNNQRISEDLNAYVCNAAVLESIYGIDHNDAVALGLGGLYDEFVIKEGDLNALNVFAEFYYGINLTLAKEIRQEYENGTKGTGCN
jgi:hypothetical protein